MAIKTSNTRSNVGSLKTFTGIYTINPIGNTEYSNTLIALLNIPSGYVETVIIMFPRSKETNLPFLIQKAK